MCGRYTLADGPTDEEFSWICETIQKNNPAALIPTGEIAPSLQAPVLTAPDTPALLTWGYPGAYGKGLLINARAETAESKPTFRQSVARQRCAVPCTGFFEWDRNKSKYLFTLPGQPLFYMAGLYALFAGEARFVILTTAANDSVADIHHRMPVILNGDKRERWLRDPACASEILHGESPILRRSADAPEQISLW